MGFFDMARKGTSDRLTPTEPSPRMDLARFDRLVEKSVKLQEIGVHYEVIERRAAAEAVTFNEALEALFSERFDA